MDRARNIVLRLLEKNNDRLKFDEILAPGLPDIEIIKSFFRPGPFL